MQSIKENFEIQCLQRCKHIKSELDKRSKLSRIQLDGEQIPSISLERKSTRMNSSHIQKARKSSSA